MLSQKFHTVVFRRRLAQPSRRNEATFGPTQTLKS